LEDAEMPEEITLKDKMSLYEEGKHRRYSLLFSVNGGAFAVAKILGSVLLRHLYSILKELEWKDEEP
jgi:hypothetical protein